MRWKALQKFYPQRPQVAASAFAAPTFELLLDSNSAVAIGFSTNGRIQ